MAASGIAHRNQRGVWTLSDAESVPRPEAGPSNKHHPVPNPVHPRGINLLRSTRVVENPNQMQQNLNLREHRNQAERQRNVYSRYRVLQLDNSHQFKQDTLR